MKLIGMSWYNAYNKAINELCIILTHGGVYDDFTIIDVESEITEKFEDESINAIKFKFKYIGIKNNQKDIDTMIIKTTKKTPII